MLKVSNEPVLGKKGHRRTKPERSEETSQKQSRVHARSLLTAGTPLDAYTTTRRAAISLKFDFKTRAEHDAQRSPLDVTARQESICSQLQAHAKREHRKRPAARQNQA